jgi:hypothetical protein
MLELKTKPQLAREAHTLASSFKLVRYRSVTYVPAEFESRDPTVSAKKDSTIWLPMRREDIRRLASAQFDTLFGSDSELASFDFMVAQNSQTVDTTATTLLVRTPKGLKQLGPTGKLTKPTGEFVPNTLQPMLNEDPDAKKRVFDVISEWVASEEEAESMLRHLATCLAPGYSAVKYVLLLGEGRNGKSLLLKMLQALFGRENVSTVTRQQIAEQSPVVTELNGKLLNIVFDGRAEYLKDSGTEKSLIAGEPVPIRLLYASTPTMVATNALFVEGLNREPKSNDKSSALQKRLVRFQFPNVYRLDHKFEKSMLTEEILGAFLSLLIDRYVREDQVAEALAPTRKALELQLEHMYVNSLALQFLKHLEDTDPLGAASLVGSELHAIVPKFQSWRLKENDLGTWAEPDVLALFLPIVNTERKSTRVNGQPRKVRVVTSLQFEASAFIESLKGSEDGGSNAVVPDDIAALVED